MAPSRGCFTGQVRSERFQLGRNVWEEDDWIDQEAVSHRGMDDWDILVG